MQTETEPDTARVGDSRIHTVGLVGGVFLLSTAAAAYEIAPASVSQLVEASLDVGPAAAGGLISVMYATAVVLSVPVGVALDRVDVRRAVVGAGLALLVAGAWGWVAAVDGDYWSLLASRAVGGAAFVALWNAGANVVGEAVDPDVRATAVGVFTASAPAGFALGQFGSPLVAGVAGWEAALPTFAALAAVGMVSFALATRGRTIGVDAAAPDRAALRAVFANRGVWLVCGLCFLAYVLYLFLNSWLPSFLTGAFGVTLAVGGLLTALFPAVGIVARTAGGTISDRGFDGRRRPVVLLAFGLAAPATLGFTVVGGVAPAVGLLVAAGVGVQLGIGLLFAYVAELVATEVRTTAVSLLTAVGLSGAFVAPMAGGFVIELAGYRPAFFVAGLVGLVGIGLAWFAPEPVRE